VIPARDGFADPPALAVREDVLAAVGGPERVRAGALADVLARIEEAGHAVETRLAAVPRRRATPQALLREGPGDRGCTVATRTASRCRGHAKWGVIRYALLALGALRANGESG
jgi:hypothetical protein